MAIYSSCDTADGFHLRYGIDIEIIELSTGEVQRNTLNKRVEGRRAADQDMTSSVLPIIS